jgi:hypothetical protein
VCVVTVVCVSVKAIASFVTVRVGRDHSNGLHVDRQRSGREDVRLLIETVGHTSSHTRSATSSSKTKRDGRRGEK